MNDIASERGSPLTQSTATAGDSSLESLSLNTTESLAVDCNFCCQSNQGMSIFLPLFSYHCL